MTETEMNGEAALPIYDRVGYQYVTRGRTIAEADVIFHGGQTGDLYPLHLDAEEAKKSPYGARVVHGTLTLSIAMGLKFDMNITGRISYGYDKVRFLKPVFIGDTIRVRVAVTRSEPDQRKIGFRRIVESMQVVNQNDEIVLAVDHILVRWQEQAAAASLASAAS